MLGTDDKDKSLREHLLYLLRGGGAHIHFDEALKDFPVELINGKAEGVPYTPWQLLEHMRIAQWDILEFSRSAARSKRRAAARATAARRTPQTRAGARKGPAIRLRRASLEEMFAHARECAPAECCGLLGGREARAESVYRLRNAARDPFVAYE